MLKKAQHAYRSGVSRVVMNDGEPRPSVNCGSPRRLLLVCLFALAFAHTLPAAAATAGRSSAQSGATTPAGPVATLEQCVTSSSPAERSATFIGEMTAMSGGRMSMRIELQERTAGEASFRTISAPGLGVWRVAASGVKVYRYIKQVTDLAAPAVYRAAVRFRWLNPRGKLIRSVERHTSTCIEPVPVAAAGA
jgi:hypothetical protein